MANTAQEKNLFFLDVLNNSIESLRLSSDEKFHSNLKRLHKYFDSRQNQTDEITNQSAYETKMVGFIEKRFRYMAENSSRIVVNQNQLQMLFDLSSDINIFNFISAYYSCFSLSPVHSKEVAVQRTSLLNQLLCAAYYDIIVAMIDNKLPRYENLAQHLVMLSESGDRGKNNKIKQIVDDVADKYKLTAEDIFVYFHNRVKNNQSFEDWPRELLNKYIQFKQDPKSATFDEFLRENNLRDLFNDNEIEKYNLLFNSYVTKLVSGQLGEFASKQVTMHSLINNQKIFDREFQEREKKKMNINLLLLNLFILEENIFSILFSLLRSNQNSQINSNYVCNHQK